jgi:iron complex outermembrane receptor protein
MLQVQPNAPRTLRQLTIAMALTLPAFGSSQPVSAADTGTQNTAKPQSAALNFNIPAQPLVDALNAFIAASDWQVGFPAGMAKDVRSSAIHGRYTPQQALQQLLTGSGLRYRLTGANTATLENAPQSQADMTVLTAMTVVGETVKDVDDPYNEDYHISNASTATKTDTPIMETPFSVQILPKVVLEDQQSIQINEVLRNVSGAYTFNDAGIVGGSITMLRGFQVGSYYRDGFPIPANTFPARRETANLERIEVLKGPGSLLYGRVDPGGVINVSTKQPLDIPFYSLQQQFGSYDLYRTTADATGPITQDGSLLYRFNLAYENSGSFTRFAGDEHIFLAPVVHWNISDRTQLTVYAEYLNDQKTPDFGVPAFSIGNRPAPVKIGFTKGEHWNRVDSESGLAGLQFAHNFNDAWKLDYQFSSFLSRNNRLVTFGAFVNPVTNELRRFSSDSSDDVDSYFTALNLTGHFSTFSLKHTLLLGTDYYHSETDSRINTGGTPSLNILAPVYNTPKFIRDPQNDSHMNVKAEWNGVYLQDQIELPYHLHLLAGGRYDNVRLSQGGDFGSTKIDMGTVKPRVGLLWAPRSEISVYGSYTENLGTFGGDATLVNPDGSRLKPEQATQWEVGLKTELFDGRLIGSLAYYELTKQNIATPHPDPVLSGLGYQVSIGEAQSRGVELDLIGQILPGWDVIASYAYTETEILKDNISENVGNQLPNVPQNGGSLWSTYRFQEGVLNGFKFGAGAYVRGQREGDAANTLQLPGYVTANLMVGYEWTVGQSKVSAQFNVENLLDKEYFQNSAGRASSTFGSPRAFIGSLRLEF